MPRVTVADTAKPAHDIAERTYTQLMHAGEFEPQSQDFGESQFAAIDDAAAAALAAALGVAAPTEVHEEEPGVQESQPAPHSRKRSRKEPARRAHRDTADQSTSDSDEDDGFVRRKKPRKKPTKARASDDTPAKATARARKTRAAQFTGANARSADKDSLDGSSSESENAASDHDGRARQSGKAASGRRSTAAGSARPSITTGRRQAAVAKPAATSKPKAASRRTVRPASAGAGAPSSRTGIIIEDDDDEDDVQEVVAAPTSAGPSKSNAVARTGKATGAAAAKSSAASSKGAGRAVRAGSKPSKRHDSEVDDEDGHDSLDDVSTDSEDEDEDADGGASDDDEDDDIEYTESESDGSGDGRAGHGLRDGRRGAGKGKGQAAKVPAAKRARAPKPLKPPKPPKPVRITKAMAIQMQHEAVEASKREARAQEAAVLAQAPRALILDGLGIRKVRATTHGVRIGLLDLARRLGSKLGRTWKEGQAGSSLAPSVQPVDFSWDSDAVHTGSASGAGASASSAAAADAVDEHDEFAAAEAALGHRHASRGVMHGEGRAAQGSHGLGSSHQHEDGKPSLSLGTNRVSLSSFMSSLGPGTLGFTTGMGVGAGTVADVNRVLMIDEMDVRWMEEQGHAGSAAEARAGSASGAGAGASSSSSSAPPSTTSLRPFKAAIALQPAEVVAPSFLHIVDDRRQDDAATAQQARVIRGLSEFKDRVHGSGALSQQMSQQPGAASGSGSLMAYGSLTAAMDGQGAGAGASSQAMPGRGGKAQARPGMSSDAQLVRQAQDIMSQARPGFLPDMTPSRQIHSSQTGSAAAASTPSLYQFQLRAVDSSRRLLLYVLVAGPESDRHGGGAGASSTWPRAASKPATAHGSSASVSLVQSWNTAVSAAVSLVGQATSVRLQVQHMDHAMGGTVAAPKRAKKPTKPTGGPAGRSKVHFEGTGSIESDGALGESHGHHWRAGSQRHQLDTGAEGSDDDVEIVEDGHTGSQGGVRHLSAAGPSSSMTAAMPGTNVGHLKALAQRLKDKPLAGPAEAQGGDDGHSATSGLQHSSGRAGSRRPSADASSKARPTSSGPGGPVMDPEAALALLISSARGPAQAGSASASSVQLSQMSDGWHGSGGCAGAGSAPPAGGWGGSQGSTDGPGAGASSSAVASFLARRKARRQQSSQEQHSSDQAAAGSAVHAPQPAGVAAPPAHAPPPDSAPTHPPARKSTGRAAAAAAHSDVTDDIESSSIEQSGPGHGAGQAGAPGSTGSGKGQAAPGSGQAAARPSVAPPASASKAGAGWLRPGALSDAVAGVSTSASAGKGAGRPSGASAGGKGFVPAGAEATRRTKEELAIESGPKASTGRPSGAGAKGKTEARGGSGAARGPAPGHPAMTRRGDLWNLDSDSDDIEDE